MVLFDADFLTFLFSDRPGKVIDPSTKKPVDKIPEKVDALIQVLHKRGEKILIPTPALSEVLAICSPSSIQSILVELSGTYHFQVAPFDEKAAVEAAITIGNAVKSRDKKGGSKSTWAKVKFDRQIVAIAKTENVTCIYSNDEDIRKFANHAGIRVTSAWELDDPPPSQPDLPSLDG